MLDKGRRFFRVQGRGRLRWGLGNLNPKLWGVSYKVVVSGCMGVLETVELKALGRFLVIL